MRLLVCGGRSYADRDHVWSVLTTLHAAQPVTLLIHGGARGADTLARDWALAHGVQHRPFWAEWDRYGKRAGVMRNTRMLNEGRPDLVLAFPGGSGTADMKCQARAAGVLVLTAASPSATVGAP